MKEQTLKILAAADDPTRWETPVGFSWEKAMLKVKRLQPAVEQLVGRSFDVDENVQDASFFTDLALQKAGEKPNQLETIWAIRFSAFGNLFTTWGYCTTEELPPDLIKQIIAVVESHGYIYVNADELNEPYAGGHEGFRKTSWWMRFFDYS